MNEEMKELTRDLLTELFEHNPEELVEIWLEWEKELECKKFSPRVKEYCRSLVEAVILQELEVSV